jgi:hypothetical protein
VDELLVSSQVGARLLARSALYPGLTELVADIVSGGEGSELYRIAIPDAYLGLSVDEVSARLRTEHRATLLSISRDGRAFVNPPADFRIASGDDAVVVAESLGTLAPLVIRHEDGTGAPANRLDLGVESNGSDPAPHPTPPAATVDETKRGAQPGFAATEPSLVASRAEAGAIAVAVPPAVVGPAPVVASAPVVVRTSVVTAAPPAAPAPAIESPTATAPAPAVARAKLVALPVVPIERPTPAPKLVATPIDAPTPSATAAVEVVPFRPDQSPDSHNGKHGKKHKNR